MHHVLQNIKILAMDSTIIAAIIGAAATIVAALIGLIRLRRTRQKKSPIPSDQTGKIPIATTKKEVDRYRVVGFDLDGTLLRGMEFSWTLVWDYLDFPEAVQKAGMRRYIKRQTTYQEWCEWACKQFRKKGLKRSDFAEITAPLKVTTNLHDTISTLKNDGFILGIISGGIDVFLHEKIPDANDLFDYIFINELIFDSSGVISGVKSTPYDFEGKAEALKKMCSDNGFTLHQSVFVGEGFNDATVATKAGLSIAYPPRTQGIKAASTIEIKEDDLSLILPHVMRS